MPGRNTLPGFSFKALHASAPETLTTLTFKLHLFFMTEHGGDIQAGNTTTVCIVGIGNRLRADDGAGAYVCELIEEQHLPGVSFLITQQLDTALIEELIQFNSVIFVDAAVNVKGFSFLSISDIQQAPQSFSHHINAAMLAALAKQLFAANTQFYICAIGADNVEMGNQLSAITEANANDAMLFITEWIQNETANSKEF